jgi:hypothetical protein
MQVEWLDWNQSTVLRLYTATGIVEYDTLDDDEDDEF